jgi:N-acetylglucosaminyldiphosphoundecaprenol N-acetyl-beta-D-mannosaminyltransferase
MVWGLHLKPFTMEDALARIDQLIDERRPTYFITANLHYAMLSSQDERLRKVNAGADFILADGMPLVWASRLMKTPLPERVAGSDLIWQLCERAARNGWRIFLLGGAEGIADEAARKLIEKHSGLAIAGIASPPFRQLTPAEELGLLSQIRDSRPDLLFIAFGQPKGELWLAEHYEKLSVPVSVQIGASLDFVAGKVRRAPRWMQRIGLEWVYRLAQEPCRLLGRYLRNGVFLVKMLITRTRNLRRHTRHKGSS